MFNMEPISAKKFQTSVPHPSSPLAISINWPRCFPLKPGSTVKLTHPLFGEIINKIALVDRNGLIWFEDNEELGLSRLDLGPASRSQIVSRVFFA